MTTMRVAQIPRAGGYFELVERAGPEPGVSQVRVGSKRAGVGHGDALVQEGVMPGIAFPRVPRHEIRVMPTT
jgi:D-arabinose 1-dehydrogenase-like Zn-dependent alcohol dehydrogenase